MAGTTNGITNEVRLDHLRWMIRARALDDRLATLYRQGQRIVGKVFLGRGQEAFSAAGTMPLRRAAPGLPGDVFAPLIRDLAGRLAFGDQMIDVVREHTGRRTARMRGRDGNVHHGDIDTGVLPMISHLGAMVSAVNGILVARRLRGIAGTVGVTAIGDGGMNTGALHEALNIAAIERLPLVLMVADNQLAFSTSSDRTYACRHLVDRAIGYGVRGHSVNGTDADACLKAMFEAVARARTGDGPQMVVATLLRLAGHGEHDDASYVDADLKSRFGDCVQLASRTLVSEGVLSEAGVQRLWDEAKAQVAAALEQTESEPEPDPAAEDWCAVSERHLTRFRS
jgi:pyruvate dehydrogenase E1 component alpha subunit/2-oxoisovalerate dehydrogenase E1 component alpha subunit